MPDNWPVPEGKTPVGLSDPPDGAIIMLVPFTMGTRLPLGAEYMCVGVTENCDCDAVEGRVGSVVAAVLLGPRPGMLRGKQVENRGSVVLNRAVDQDLEAKSAIVPSSPRSTSMSSVLSSLTPVSEELPLQTPPWSDSILIQLNFTG